MHRWEFQESAETDEFTRVAVVSQPEPHTAPLEQTDAVADALLTPLSRKQLAVHQVAPDVVVVTERMKIVKSRVGHGLILQPLGHHGHHSQRGCELTRALLSLQS